MSAPTAVRPSFVRDLAAFESSLRARWNCSSNLWEIWSYPSHKRPYRVITVTNEKGGFRELDNRVFIQLAFSDRERYGSSREHLAAIDNAFNQIKSEAARQVKDIQDNHVAPQIARELSKL